MIRPAETAEDFAFVVDLAVRSVVFGIPSSREQDEESLRARARVSLESLESTCRSGLAITLVAWEDARRVGYLILQLEERDPFSGAAQSFIYDLAVEPDRWGSYVVNRLVAEAARQSYARGYRWMVGEVTRDNLRTLVQARRLGFVIERVRLGIGCGPAGRVPLEQGRDTAYARSREIK